MTLDIKGVPWDIPRIDTELFTTEKLRAILRLASTAVQPNPRQSSNLRNETFVESLVAKPVKYVWIDIACIDQRLGILTSTAEAGRQAVVFKGARVVFG